VPFPRLDSCARSGEATLSGPPSRSQIDPGSDAGREVRARQSSGLTPGCLGPLGRNVRVLPFQYTRLAEQATHTGEILWRLFQRPEKGGVSAGIEAKARAIHQSLISDGQRARQNVVRQAALGDLRDPRC
jgi:hypothetical protein